MDAGAHAARGRPPAAVGSTAGETPTTDETADAVVDDPDRLSADELPWGVPARATVAPGEFLPPPTVVDTRHRGRQVLRQVAIAAGIVLVLILLVLAFSR